MSLGTATTVPLPTDDGNGNDDEEKKCCGSDFVDGGDFVDGRDFVCDRDDDVVAASAPPALIHRGPSFVIRRAAAAPRGAAAGGGGFRGDDSEECAAAAGGGGGFGERRRQEPPLPSVASVRKAVSSSLSASEEDAIAARARLGNEYNVLTRALGGAERGGGVRRAIRRSVGPDGRTESVYLEYAEGETLGEWIRGHPLSLGGEGEGGEEGECGGPPPSEEGRESLLDRALVARGVASALADVNDAGVTHNCVAPSSFVVDYRRRRRSGRGGEDARRAASSSCVVKIIGFGYAAFRSGAEADDGGERVNDDLHALGSVLLALFSEGGGGTPDDEEGDDAPYACDLGLGPGFDIDGASGTAAPSSEPDLPARLPRSVRILLSNLGVVGADGSGPRDPYRSAREVEEDLDQMLEDPDGLLFDPPPGDDLGRVRLSPSKLYGREEEASVLAEACRRICRRPADCDGVAAPSAPAADDDDGGDASVGSARSDGEASSAAGGVGRAAAAEAVIVVSGPAGAGKSELIARTCRPIVEARGGFFLPGKFDRLGRPYSGLASALSALCDQLLSRGDGAVRDMAAKMRDAVGSLGRLVADVVGPGLVEVLGGEEGLPPAPPGVTGAEAQDRLKYVFRRFVRAVSRPEHPVVLSLDDLQWADASSVELIKALLLDSSGNGSMLLVGSYRDDETSRDRPALEQLRTMEASGRAKVEWMELGDLSAEDVNRLVSDALRTPRRLTRPLADVVRRKTNGNALFVVQFLRSLADEGLLSYDSATRRWRWDVNELGERNVSPNVVELLTAKMMKLPPDERRLLQTASCMGSHFDESTLFPVMDAKREDGTGRGAGGDGNGAGGSDPAQESSGSLAASDLERKLAALDRGGFLLRSSSSMTAASAQLKFAHDRVRQAAYQLLPERDRAALHLRIGHVLREDAEAKGDLGRRLFQVVDQLNLGSSLVVEGETRADLAGLNLRAGERAVKESAFVPAASYLRAGLRLLPEGDARWSDAHYGMTLRMYSCLAEAELVNGNFEETDGAIEIVLRHAGSVLDKFPAYMCLVKSYIARGKLQEAIAAGFDVLSQLGEKFPKTASAGIIVKDLLWTKLMMRGRTDADIYALPAMKRPEKVAAMRMLSVMASACYLARPEFTALVTFRMMRLSLRSGLCRESAFGFATYGMILSGVLGSHADGYRFARLALTLLDRLDAREWLARVYGLAYYFVAHAFDAMRPDLPRFLIASRVAMEVGDVEYAALNRTNYCWGSFQCGRPLGPLRDDICAFAGQMSERRQDVPLTFLLPLWRCVRNLMGGASDPLRPTGDAIDDGGGRAVEEARAAGCTEGTAECLGGFCRLFLAYTFGRYEAASEVAERSRGIIAKVLPGMFLVVKFDFYDGLAACALARETRCKRTRRRCMRVGRDVMRRMRRRAARAPSNCSHKYLLLKAEDAVLGGKAEAARRAYDASIAAARENSFVQDEALAYERAALFFGENDDRKLASRYIVRAQQLYLEWGAKAKADQILVSFYAMVASARDRASFQDFRQNRSAAPPQAAS